MVFNRNLSTLKKSLLGTIFLLVAACSVQEPDGVQVSQTNDIAKSRTVFKTVSDAIVYLENHPSTPRNIFISPGIYREKIRVTIDGLKLIGSSRETTIIEYDDHGDSKDTSGNRLGTSGSATVTINAKDFSCENITIKNGFDYPGNAAKDPDDPSKIKSTQAVALYITGKSDRSILLNCRLIGYQDTFYADAGRTYVSDSEILGHVDFIFGAGQLVVENSTIISRNRIGKNPTGYITAPSTSIEEPYGMLFNNCRFIKEDETVPDGSVRLGRPWHPNADLTVSGSVVFRDCFMDSHIGTEGYGKISSRNKNGDRVWFEVGPDSRFFEYMNTGPGAIKSNSRPQLLGDTSVWYTKANVLNGWK